MRDVPQPDGARFQDIVQEARRQCEDLALTGAYPLADWRDISLDAFARLEEEISRPSDERWIDGVQRVVAASLSAGVDYIARLDRTPEPSVAVRDLLLSGDRSGAIERFRQESGAALGTATVRVRQLARREKLPWPDPRADKK